MQDIPTLPRIKVEEPSSHTVLARDGAVFVSDLRESFDGKLDMVAGVGRG